MLDDLVRAVGQRVRPGTEPPAQRRRRLEQRDGHPRSASTTAALTPAIPPPTTTASVAVRDGAWQPRVGGDDDAGAHAQRRGPGGEGGGAEHAVEPDRVALERPTGVRAGMRRAPAGLAPT